MRKYQFYSFCNTLPTLSRGIKRSSDPNLRNTAPADWFGCTPIPSLVTTALVLGSTRNSSAAYLITAVNGVASGTFITLLFFLNHTRQKQRMTTTKQRTNQKKPNLERKLRIACKNDFECNLLLRSSRCSASFHVRNALLKEK